MRAYYLNPNITPEGLKKLDAQSDAHVAMCKTELSKLISEQRWDDPEAVKACRAQMMSLLVTQMLLFG